MRRSLALATITPAFLVVLLASSSYALTGRDLACQTAIGTAAQHFAAVKHKAIVECNNVTIGGGTCNTARRDKRILKAADKLARSIVAACRNVRLADLGFPGQCFDATSGDFVVGDLTECLEEIHGFAIDFVFIPVEYPGASGLFGTELRCQRAIGSAGQSFVARKLRARSQCLDGQLRRKIPASVNCRAEVAPFGGGTGDRKTDGRIIAAANNLFARLLEACSGVTLEHLGFPGSFCFDDNGGIFDLTDLRSCVHVTHENIADQLIDIQYPLLNPNPTPTPPSPTPTATPAVACDFAVARFVPLAFGQDLDLGWTGLMHDQSFVTGAALSVAITGCENAVRPCGLCTFEGPIANANANNGVIDNRRCAGDTLLRCGDHDDCGAAGPCAFFFGSPLPVAGGGIGTCLVNQIDGEVSGSIESASGEAAASLGLITRMFVGVQSDRPCPVCVGDILANDGAQNGVCGGGLHDGDPCDVNGSSPVSSFGATSLDCPPSGAGALAALNLQWDLTTGTEVRTLSSNGPNCTGVADRKCFCDAAGSEPTRPNACLDDTSTPDEEQFCVQSISDEGICPVTVDTVCAVESFRGCTNDAECPLAGDSCVARNRECYTDNGFIGGSVFATGTASPFFADFAFPTLATLFCTGPVASAAVNAAAGLPGLGRLKMPTELSLSTE